jgi:hypothetical protein
MRIRKPDLLPSVAKRPTVPLRAASAGDAASEYAFTGPADVVENGAGFIEQNAPQVVGTVAQGVSFLNEIASYVSTIKTVVSALESCF